MVINKEIGRIRLRIGQMVTDVHSHIIDEDRKKNKELYIINDFSKYEIQLFILCI